MITDCPNAHEGCPYFDKPTPKALRGEQSHGCRADTDHIIPRWMGRAATASPLLRNYIRSKANQQQLCRLEHDKKTIEDWDNPPLPPTDFEMVTAIKGLHCVKRKRTAA